VTTNLDSGADPSAQQSPEPSRIRLELVSSYCGSNSCPTIYRTDRGTLVVQGYAVEADETGLSLPQGELLVEIPTELLAAAARAAL
jgi:hypothetical protein